MKTPTRPSSSTSSANAQSRIGTNRSTSGQSAADHFSREAGQPQRDVVRQSGDDAAPERGRVPTAVAELIGSAIVPRCEECGRL